MNTVIHSDRNYKFESEVDSIQPLIIHTAEYSLPSLSFNDNSGLSFQPALPSDINIFTELSKDALQIRPIYLLVRELWNSIRRQSRQEISLSKLIDTRQDDGSILLEWIFWSCRVSFQFYEDGSYIYCLAFNDLKTNTFSSLCESFKEEEFQKVADLVVEFIYKHI